VHVKDIGRKTKPLVGRLRLDLWHERKIWVRLLVRRGFEAVNSANENSVNVLQGSIGDQSRLVSVLSLVENAL
jgi:hypothetical protein